MMGNLVRFSIFKLWGERDVHLKFNNNSLILVGENGSGKTTILRIVYETLSCKWTMLSVEDFFKIEIEFINNVTVEIEKSEIQNAKDLFISRDSDILRAVPPFVRHTLIEKSNISGRDISCDQLIETLRESDYHNEELIEMLREKMNTVEKEKIALYNNAIKDNLKCNIIYLPTYRRVEKRIGYLHEKEYEARRFQYPIYRSRNKMKADENQSIEIAKTGMDDVEYFIRLSLDDIQMQADISASRLNYQCFKGILNKVSEKVTYNKKILAKEEIEKVFGSINEEVLSSLESMQIQKQLLEMESIGNIRPQTYEQIVYYFYSLLHERYVDLKESEKVILKFFDACNAYLRNKKFVYDEKKYKYDIYMTKGKYDRKISLENLSSGEKQIVSIFSYLYLSTYAKSIVLIDEPELSLSVPWQRKFLLDIYKGTQCAGIVSVTHSPFVFDNELRPYAHALEEFIR